MKFKMTLSTLAFLMLMPFSAVVNAHGGSGMGMMGSMDDDEYQGRMMQQRGMMGGMGMMSGQGMMGGMSMMNGMGMMGGMMGPVMMLELDDDQRESFQDMHREMQKENWERMGEMMELRNQLQDIMASEDPNTNAASRVFDKMANIRKQMFMDRLQARNQMMKKLNDEQREQLREYQHRGMMME